MTDPRALSYEERPAVGRQELPEEHWRGLEEGVVRLPRCADCKRPIRLVADRCLECGSWDQEWVEVEPEACWPATSAAAANATELCGPVRTLLYIPDIDGWEIPGHSLSDVLGCCDLALLDGTFYRRDELPRQADIPHPPIAETLDLLTPEEAAKVRFIHLNHTNPVLDPDGPTALVAVQGEMIPLD